MFIWKVKDAAGPFILWDGFLSNRNSDYEKSVKQRYVLQAYTPEFTVRLQSDGRGREFRLAFENTFIVLSNDMQQALAFKLFGFGIGVSRATDKELGNRKATFEKWQQEKQN